MSQKLVYIDTYEEVVIKMADYERFLDQEREVQALRQYVRAVRVATQDVAKSLTVPDRLLS
jgi:hypothetical protein